jgi:hypothetical protein
MKIKKLGMWFSTQLHNYKNKKNIMLDEDIDSKWTYFINDKKYF